MGRGILLDDTRLIFERAEGVDGVECFAMCCAVRQVTHMFTLYAHSEV